MIRIPVFRLAGCTAAMGALVAGLAGQALAGDWYFYVQNASSSRLTRLEVKEKGGEWGYFDIGSGIAPGEKVRLEWDKSTNNEDCKQSIRAFFADGSGGEPAVMDFCSDLETPVVFSD